MQLSSYLKRNEISLAAFGERIKRSAATVSRIARGLHRPDWATMQAIEKATEGKVKPNDFRIIQARPSPTSEPTPPAAVQGDAA